MSELPAGTLTFLLTDIEGSTRMWEKDPEAMRQALERHDALLSSGIEAHGGTVHGERGEGDSFFATFPRARQAVAAAAAIQRALHKEDWPEGLALRVRMALHTGEAEAGYWHALINRCARLRAIAHGGQVLLSSATEVLVREGLPARVSLCDLGEHRLRDLARPERTYQLLHPELPSDFPPLASLAAYQHNLPIQLTSFIGREREVESIKEFLASGRLVTITGAGGSGKTRLALQVGADLLEDYADGVFVVALASLREESLISSTIARTVGLRETEGRPLLETLKEHVREKRMLLVLDNCEHLPAAAPLVADLLAASTELRVLATSRAPLHLRGEQEFALVPLALPDGEFLPPSELAQYEAVRLFVERSRAARADFALTSENAQAIADICVRLDGLPLAIELAAARSKLLSPAALRARLAEPLRLLTGGARDLPARQQTLRSTIAWSYELLGAEEQRLFRRLSVFVGGCTLEAAEAVCNASGDLGHNVFEGLASLVDNSLLRQVEGPGEEPRFRMLEAVREYAQEQLAASGEEEAARLRHADYVQALAEESEPKLIGAEQATWLARLEAEHNNLRAALAWMLERGEAERALRLGGALWRLWLTHGHFSEGRKWLERALVAGGDRTIARAKALDRAGMLALRQGDYAGARSLIEEALALQRDLGDKRGTAVSLNNLGNAAGSQGDYAMARSLYGESLALRRELGDKWGISASLNFLGTVSWREGDYAAARRLYEESLALRRELGDKGVIAVSLNNLGVVACYQGDYAAARSLYEESLALWRELGDKGGIGVSLDHLGEMALYQGDYVPARSLLEEALTLQRELGDKWGIAESLGGLGEVARRQGDDEGATTLLKESLAVWRALGARADIARCLERLARTLVPQSSEQACRLLGSAAALREALGAPLPPVERAEHERSLTEARVALGEDRFAAAWAAGRSMTLEEAIGYALEAEEVSTAVGPRAWTA